DTTCFPTCRARRYSEKVDALFVKSSKKRSLSLIGNFAVLVQHRSLRPFRRIRKVTPIYSEGPTNPLTWKGAHGVSNDMGSTRIMGLLTVPVTCSRSRPFGKPNNGGRA